MTRSKLEVEEGEEVVRRTIVGGRPAAKANKKLRVPIGVEKLLYQAAADSAFRSRLLHDREATLQEPGVHLSESERAIVRSVPAATLSTMIDQIDLPRHGKKRFLRAVAACTLAAATVLATADCTGPTPTGARPDEPLPDNAAESTTDIPSPDGHIMDAGGARPDLPPEEAVIESPDMAPAGILPDLPDKKP